MKPISISVLHEAGKLAFSTRRQTHERACPGIQGLVSSDGEKSAQSTAQSTADIRTVPAVN
jgi:hypothetical protein